MGQLSQFFQPPLDWQQFEELTRGLVDQLYNTQSSMIGRSGQAQDGVDIYARTQAVGHLGVQCKRLSIRDDNNNLLANAVISPAMLKEEAEIALNFRPTLNTWVLATTAKRDARIQKSARNLTEAFEKRGVGVRVQAWFWDDYVSWLNLFPDLQRWYYDKVIHIRSSSEQDELILSLIATAFHRPAFSDPLYSENADDLLQAIKDTHMALRTGELVDRKSKHVIQKAIGGWRSLSNSAWKAELKGLESDLQTLKIKMMEAIKEKLIVQHSNYLEIRDPQLVEDLEYMRASCVRRLNIILLDGKLEEI
ncbi:hypothetical protein DEM27_28345 [Metarhizobium album]|uniref:Restriction endonuclease type IV Mrr domain-containing protein n=1 Tax=Metarhizobium album TaxID=2182425 RepID=A0A2U2DI54_9HYPH|nr:hypothetical protein [Rhizobium album]PWE52996.1 hypothetical protein DEM27_28345 [Rhizobium album]